MTQEDPHLETNTWQTIPLKQQEHLPLYSDCESAAALPNDECDDAKVNSYENRLEPTLLSRTHFGMYYLIYSSESCIY